LVQVAIDCGVVVPRVTVTSPCVLGARWSSTVKRRAPVVAPPEPKVGLSIMR